MIPRSKDFGWRRAIPNARVRLELHVNDPVGWDNLLRAVKGRAKPNFAPTADRACTAKGPAILTGVRRFELDSAPEHRVAQGRPRH